MAQIIDRFTRSRYIFGENFEKLQKAKGIIFGCGGVGGAAIDCLYRSGVVNLVVVDCDKFEITNQNRQIFSENLDEFKAEIFAKNLPKVRGIVKKIDNNLKEFEIENFDFIVDAIDDIPAKIQIAKSAYENKKIFISSMGGAKRLDPTKILIDKIFKTYNDPFAKKIRYELKKANLNYNFDCVYSNEEPLKLQNLGSFKGVTATFGNIIASYIIRKLISKI